ncbi:MAG: hypothetical protein AB7G62_00505 [Magnetospirillum sp.]
MKPLRESWQGAEGWVDRYNALLVAGLADARLEDMRAELDTLLADIAHHHRDQADMRALGDLLGGTPRPLAPAQDMVRLYDWISAR